MQTVMPEPAGIARAQPLSGRPNWFTPGHGAAALGILVLLGLRVFAALHYRVDSDEPQHLHVVWAWANGLLQYRDVFDNHSPLFQMLCAPLFRVLGERADIIIPMRLAMIPLFFLSVWCVFKIGARLTNRPGGLVAAALTAFYPTYFFVTTEYRTDDLWVALWLVSLLILVSGKLRGQRAFWFGIVIGAAFSTSMKTTLLVISLALAAVGVLFLERLSGRRPRWREFVSPAALILAGVVIIPSALIAFFAAKGALGSMYYCIVQHNTVPGLGKWRTLGFHQFIFPLSVPPVLAAAWFLLRSHTDHTIGASRALLLLTAAFYLGLLRSYWPLVTAQDYAPLLPVFFLGILPAIWWIGNQTARLHPSCRYALPAFYLSFELYRCWQVCPLRTNDVAPFCRHLAETLRLADRDDYVMDAKGETIFRKRPFYYVLEGITIMRMKHGLIADDLPQTLVNTATNVIFPHRMSDADYAFIKDNYVEVTRTAKVAGKLLGDAEPGRSVEFNTLWPARYTVVSENGDAQGVIDGEPLSHHATLPAGAHSLQLTAGTGRVALVWAQAIERGFSPFIKRPK
ncbi:MAG: hypothetical protein QOD99_238 [Chthoniobacter sp.]|jgi:hypothetical protein|nr:hypothetical protein [Chthoniobacter sp.]